MAKFAQDSSDDELLAYCVAYGLIIGMVLGFSTGFVTGNSFIGPMGAAVGIFIGLAVWFVLSD